MTGSLNPSQYTAFELRDFDLDLAMGRLSLRYCLVGSGVSIDFFEEITLPPLVHPSASFAECAKRTGRIAFLACSVSYYKAGAPPVVRTRVPVTEAEGHFLSELFAGGLTQFAYANNLPAAVTPTFLFEEFINEDPLDLSVDAHGQASPLCPIGGGKDSIVTLEALRNAGYRPQLFSVNQ